MSYSLAFWKELGTWEKEQLWPLGFGIPRFVILSLSHLSDCLFVPFLHCPWSMTWIPARSHLCCQMFLKLFFPLTSNNFLKNQEYEVDPFSIIRNVLLDWSGWNYSWYGKWWAIHWNTQVLCFLTIMVISFSSNLVGLLFLDSWQKSQKTFDRH